MRAQRTLLAGIMLACVAAIAAVLLKLLVAVLVILSVVLVTSGCAMFFWERVNRLTKGSADAGTTTPEERLARVLDLNRTIQQQAGRVRSTNLRRALERGCELVPEIMGYTQQRDPDNLAVTAAQIGAYLGSVHTALTTYLDMQDAPQADTPRKLHEGGRVLQGFPEFVINSKEQLESGDAAVYRANLRVLQPMSIKGAKG